MENLIKKFESKNGNRIFYLDQLRALAIIGVIGIHVSPYFLDSLTGASFLFISEFAIPIFLMLSGVLLLNKEYSISEFLKKRYPRIIIPFLFWGCVFVIFAILFQNMSFHFSSLETGMLFIGNMFLGIQGYLPHFWYVWLILSVYLFFPIINKWIKNSSFSEIRYFLFIWFITSIFATFDFPYYYIDLRYFAGSIGFVILGYYLAKDNNKIIGNIFLWSLLFLISTIVRVVCYDLSIGTNHFTIYSTLSVIQAASFFLMIKNFNDNKLFTKVSSFLKNGVFGSLTVLLSKYSYGIYLVHVLFILSFKILIDFTNKSAIIWIPFLIIVTLLFSLGFLIILNKIPILNKITGVH
ncbi:MAG: acyltransferase [Methanobrevibacter sp.]|nr:acyltransferase [Methanobrevibacter sp.]